MCHVQLTCSIIACAFSCCNLVPKMLDTVSLLKLVITMFNAAAA